MDPAKTTSGADGRYWQSLAEGKLELPRCAGCGKWHWPAVWRCGACGSWSQEWHAVEPAGTIYAWTRTWHAFGGLDDIPRPFVSLVVQLDGVPVRLTGILEAVSDAPVAIGARVRGTAGTTPFAGDTVTALRWQFAGQA